MTIRRPRRRQRNRRSTSSCSRNNKRIAKRQMSRPHRTTQHAQPANRDIHTEEHNILKIRMRRMRRQQRQHTHREGTHDCEEHAETAESQNHATITRPGRRRSTNKNKETQNTMKATKKNTKRKNQQNAEE